MRFKQFLIEEGGKSFYLYEFHWTSDKGAGKVHVTTDTADNYQDFVGDYVTHAKGAFKGSVTVNGIKVPYMFTEFDVSEEEVDDDYDDYKESRRRRPSRKFTQAKTLASFTAETQLEPAVVKRVISDISEKIEAHLNNN